MSYISSLLLSKKPSGHIPIWFMRQAGRYLPEYREVRQNYPDFLAFISNPKDAAKVTIQPLERFDLDGAIIFSDILIIPWALGQGVRFEVGEGPKLDAIQNPEDIKKLTQGLKFDQTITPTLEALSLVAPKLQDHQNLIGFSGSPWTLACYMIEGQGSPTFSKAIAFARQHPQDFAHLQSILIEAVIAYTRKQIDAGAQVIQLFDSWAGLCPSDLYGEYVVNANRLIVEGIRKTHPQCPIICFPKGSGLNYKSFVEIVKPNGISIDPMAPANILKDLDVVVQGGLAPEHLLQGGDLMLNSASAYLKLFKGEPYIFNLGHGIIKETKPDHVSQLISFVRSQSEEKVAL